MAVLFSRHLRYDWVRPDRPDNDHLIFSKGHASPLLYSLYKAAGAISDEELLETYRQARHSPRRATPRPVLPWVDVATGSLGQGLPDRRRHRARRQAARQAAATASGCCCGDSELAEGSIWEAFDKASHYGLDNLTAIVDVNRLGQRGPTELGWDTDAYAARASRPSAGTGDRDRRPRPRGDRRRLRARRSSGDRHRPSSWPAPIKGKGVRCGRGHERLARQAARRGVAEARDRRSSAA